VLTSFGIIIYLSWDYDKTTDRYTFITTSFLNVLILAAIVVQALIYYVQWAVMAMQSKLMAESLVETRKSADAANRAAEAALNANRAWVLVEKISAPDMFSEVNTQVRNEIAAVFLGFQFKVFGRTPCRVIESRFRFRLVPGRRRGAIKEPDLPEPRDYGQPVTILDNPEMSKTIFPDEEFTGTVSLEEDAMELFRSTNLKFWADVQQREQFICAYGFIKYQDAFDGAAIRETNFCYVYRRSVGAILVDAKTGKPLMPDGFTVGGPPGYNNAT